MYFQIRKSFYLIEEFIFSNKKELISDVRDLFSDKKQTSNKLIVMPCYSPPWNKHQFDQLHFILPTTSILCHSCFINPKSTSSLINQHANVDFIFIHFISEIYFIKYLEKLLFLIKKKHKFHSQNGIVCNEGISRVDDPFFSK